MSYASRQPRVDGRKRGKVSPEYRLSPSIAMICYAAIRMVSRSLPGYLDSEVVCGSAFNCANGASEMLPLASFYFWLPQRTLEFEPVLMV